MNVMSADPLFLVMQQAHAMQNAHSFMVSNVYNYYFLAQFQRQNQYGT